MRPFRFALQTSTAPDAATWRERARKAEDLGYSAMYVPDHFDDQWGPLVALTVAAEATTRLKVGPLVLGNDYRHPVVAAKEISTLDLVSEGRVEFGIGAGWMRTDYEAAGMPYDEPAERVDRLEEAVAIYKQLLRDGTASLEGEHYRVTEAACHPRPASRSGPSLLIGGGGRRVLSLAAREADIVGVNPNLRSGATDQQVARSAVAAKYDRRLEWIREAAGDRFDDLDLQLLTFLVAIGGDRHEVAEAMGPPMGISPEEALEVPLALVGSVDEICEQLHERRERWGLNYWVVHDPELEAFGEVVARLGGT
jgi:probable F420-dependent oxidoreductase